MQITDDLIRGLSSEELFDRDFLYSWLETPEPEERQRLLSLMEIRAKDLGVQKRFASTAKEYIKADETQKMNENGKLQKSVPFTSLTVMETESLLQALTTSL